MCQWIYNTCRLYKLTPSYKSHVPVATYYNVATVDHFMLLSSVCKRLEKNVFSRLQSNGITAKIHPLQGSGSNYN